MLRPFLSLIHDDPQIAGLQRDAGRAFVASSLRPYLVAALADEVLAANAPALVVAGDDRQARDLAHDLEAWLPPRPRRPPRPPPPPPPGPAPPARPATSPTTSRPGSRRGPCASTRAAASPT